MTKPIAVQLYSVRDALAQDFESVIKKVAAAGYQGVEPYGGLDAKKVAEWCKTLGLQIPSTHSDLPLGDKREAVLASAKTLGVKYLICPHISADEFKTVEGAIAVCNRLNEANKIARDAGLTFGYHNHWFEFEPISGMGTYPNKVMSEYLDPTVCFEIDTYWAQVGGQDPIAVIKELGARAPLLHIKDGPADNKNSDMVAVGEGAMDINGILDAGKSAEWLIVELDRCGTDMVTAVEKSYTNLEALARGK